jgi:hypothetical protein
VGEWHVVKDGFIDQISVRQVMVRCLSANLMLHVLQVGSITRGMWPDVTGMSSGSAAARR